MKPASRRHTGNQTAAFTLLELVVVAAILMLLSAISFPTLVRSYQQQKLRQAAMEAQSMLQQGRSLAQRLQGSCGISFGNDATKGVVLRATPAPNFSGTNSCTDQNLNQLLLTQSSAVQGLSVRREVITIGSGGTDVFTAESCGSSTACAATFNSLGLLSGNRQILYLSAAGISTQYCVHLSLNLNRVGFRNGSSGACNYSRN